MVSIDVGDGLIAFIDDEDYPRVSKHTWRIRDDGYVQRTWKIGDRYHHELLHRFVLRAAPEDLVDHWRGERWDCRKENLRIVTHQQNCMNRAPRDGRQYKGIYPHGRKWKARIKMDGVNQYIGIFDSPEDAARAYDEAARQMFGEFARLNFP